MKQNLIDSSRYVFENDIDAMRFVKELKRRYNVRSLKSASNIILVVDKSIVPERLLPCRTAKFSKKFKPNKHYVIIGFDIPEEYARRIANIIRKGPTRQLETVIESVDENVESKIATVKTSIPAAECMAVFEGFNKKILLNPAVNSFLITDIPLKLLENDEYIVCCGVNVPRVSELRTR